MAIKYIFLLFIFGCSETDRILDAALRSEGDRYEKLILVEVEKPEDLMLTVGRLSMLSGDLEYGNIIYEISFDESGELDGFHLSTRTEHRFVPLNPS